MTDRLLRFRDRFPILERTTYLISNSLGAMPAQARDRLAAYADTWATRGVRAWAEGWWELALTTGSLLSPVLGTTDVSFHQNATIAAAVFLSALDFRGERKRIVTTDMEFPTMHYLLHAHPDAEIVTVRSHDGIGIDTAELCAAIDERTVLVVFSHVLFKSSFIVDAAAVAARARAAGALTLLDTFQSAGSIPVDLPTLGVDAAVGGCLKWLCGGPGNCFLWVEPSLAATLTPRLAGWQAHPRPFAFETGPIALRDGPGRFLTGTPNIPALYAAEPGLRIVADAGIDEIRAKSIRQTTRLIERFDGHGWRVTAPRDAMTRAGTVAVDVPHGVGVAAELNARDICVDYRPGAGVRLSPHFYTRNDELDFAADQIAEILASGAYERHLGVARTVT